VLKIDETGAIPSIRRSRLDRGSPEYELLDESTAVMRCDRVAARCFSC